MSLYPVSSVLARILKQDSFKKLEGSLTLYLPNGEVLEIGNGQTGQLEPGRLTIHKMSGLSRVVRNGLLGFADAYIRKEFDTPDLKAVFHFFVTNRERILANLPELFRLGKAARSFHRRRENTHAGSRDNIHAHYDLGNAFYSQWLDESMTYSSALFESEGQGLSEAQDNKYRRIIELARLEGANKVLEIGCGWGGFAELAARETNAQVTGISISRAQLEYAGRRIAEAGLSDQVELRFEDYRDTAGTFDALVSIEMIEAVGEQYWPLYFQTLRDRLSPGGTAVLQAITISPDLFDSYRERVDFIQRYIFPGGMLMTNRHVHDLAEQTGMTVTRVEEFPDSYARTLGLWHERFNRCWETISELGFDDTFRRKWNYYLKYCEAGFEAGTISVGLYQLVHSGSPSSATDNYRELS
ncbi:MAG: cyclopropane-fatty-acyl-phospholipid synthase family protein [Stappiaceae bacterium]